MAVHGNLLHRQRHAFHPTGLSESETIAKVNGKASPQIGQSESRLTIAAVRRADQIEERLVLRNRQQLSFAKHPARRSEVARKHSDFTNVWLCHRSSPF